MDAEAFWDIMEQYEKQETGGGLIAKVKVEMGYKVFVGGMGNEESWFAFAPGDEVAKKAALNKARETGGRPQLSLCFIAFKDSVKGREVGWQGDRYFVYPHWTDAYKEIVKPAMKDLGVTIGLQWLRFSWKDDPSGRQEADQEGNARTALIAFPVEKFANEAAATKAGGEQEARFSEGVEPEPWLLDLAPKLAKDDGLTAAQIAEKVSQPLAAVEAALQLAA